MFETTHTDDIPGSANRPTLPPPTVRPRAMIAVPMPRRTGGAAAALPTHPSETAYPIDYANAPQRSYSARDRGPRLLPIHTRPPIGRLHGRA